MCSQQGSSVVWEQTKQFTLGLYSVCYICILEPLLTATWLIPVLYSGASFNSNLVNTVLYSGASFNSNLVKSTCILETLLTATWLLSVQCRYV